MVSINNKIIRYEHPIGHQSNQPKTVPDSSNKIHHKIEAIEISQTGGARVPKREPQLIVKLRIKSRHPSADNLHDK